MPDHDLTAMIDAYLDGNLTPEAFAALSQRLREDSEAARLFARRAADHHALRQLHTKTTAPLKPGDALVPGRTPTRPNPRPLSAAGAPIYRKGHEPQTKSAIGNRQLAILCTALAATLLAACGLAIYLLAFNAAPSDIEPRPSNIEHPPVATLIHTSGGGDLRTPHGYPAEGNDYSAGEYTLTSGRAEFMLTNAVNVKLRGRSRMVMHSERLVSLSHGSASFVVPKEAEGFTVQLPDGSRVVDLGTAFTINIIDGQPHLHVTDGLVRVDIDNHSTLVEAPTRIAIVDGVPTQLPPGHTLAEMLAMPGIVDAHDGSLATAPESWHAVSTIAGRQPEQLYVDGDPVVALRDDSTRGRLSIHRPLTDRPLSDREWAFETRLSVSTLIGMRTVFGVRDEGDGGRCVILSWADSDGSLALYNPDRTLTLFRSLGDVDLTDGEMHTYRIEKRRIDDGFEVTVSVDGDLMHAEPIDYAQLPAAIDSTNGAGVFSSTPGTADVMLDYMLVHDVTEVAAEEPRNPSYAEHTQKFETPPIHPSGDTP